MDTIEELENALNKLRDIGDDLDDEGLGVYALTDGSHSTRECLNLELGHLLLYLANSNGNITDGEATLLNIVMGDVNYCDKYSLSRLAAITEEPKPDLLLSLMAFLAADKAINQSSGTKDNQMTDMLIHFYEMMASIIAVCDQNTNSDAEKKKMKFLNGMETYVKKNL